MPTFTAGADDVSVYPSSDWGERCFCRKCGSALFWRMPDGPHYAISAGALDDASEFAFGTQIFIDEKPAFYDFANDTPKLTGAEVAAMFSEGGSGA